MNSQSKKTIYIGITACSIFLGSFAPPVSAQSKSSPQTAPSFMQKAGQKILDNAQKNILHNVNQSLQNQQQIQTQTTPAYSGDPSSLLYSQGAPAATPPRKAAPCRSWVNPNEKPVAILLCIHGLGLQSNSYEFFGKEQSKRGIAVYAIDVRGFGAWMNAGGKAQVNFNDCLLDIKQSAESIRAANPGIPMYILGESMGGAIALRAASMYPELIDGLISAVPAGERFNQGKTSMKVFLNLLSGFNLANVGGDVLNAATKNEKLRTKWQEDPLARLNLSPQELIQFQDFMNTNHDAAKKVTDMPVLFVQGNGDQLVKPEGTWELFNDVAAKDKSFFAVPGEHLIFEEAQTQDAGPRDQNFRVISSWLQTKVGRRHGRRPMGQMASASSVDAGPYADNSYGAPSYGDGSYNSGGGYGGGSYGGNSYGGSSGGGRASMGSRLPIDTTGLETQVQLIDNKQYGKAIAQLEQMRVQRPTDSNVAALLGRAYLQNNQADKAGMMFRRAMRLTRGRGDQARAFNSYLLGMNTDSQNNSGQTTQPLPFAGGGGALGQIVSGLGNYFGVTTPGTSQYSTSTTTMSNIAPTAVPSNRGRVYAFYANWADQCKGMNDSLTQLSATYGNQVDIQRVDIENAASDPLVEQFKIGPIPTVIFVAPNGQVSSTIIGESTRGNYEAALRAIAK